MQVSVFGSSGKVGRLVVEELLNEGYQVVAFIHHRSPFEPTAQLSLIKGDINNQADVAAALSGSQVVISTLGSWGTKEKNILSTAMQAIVAQMELQTITRLVSLTGADARAKGDKLNFRSGFVHQLIEWSPAHKILHDGEEHLKILEASELEWSVIRSPIMNNIGNPDRYSLTIDTPPGLIGSINRRSVAKAILELVKEPNFIKQAPYIKRI